MNVSVTLPAITLLKKQWGWLSELLTGSLEIRIGAGLVISWCNRKDNRETRPYKLSYSKPGSLERSEGQSSKLIALRAGLVTLCLYEHPIWTQLQVQEL